MTAGCNTLIEIQVTEVNLMLTSRIKKLTTPFAKADR
jgi:hypothetical protein